jgi:hypothetical protein
VHHRNRDGRDRNLKIPSSDQKGLFPKDLRVGQNRKRELQERDDQNLRAPKRAKVEPKLRDSQWVAFSGDQCLATSIG